MPSQIISNWFPECDIEFTVQRRPPDFNPIGCGGIEDSEMDVQSIGKVVFSVAHECEKNCLTDIP